VLEVGRQREGRKEEGRKTRKSERREENLIEGVEDGRKEKETGKRGGRKREGGSAGGHVRFKSKKKTKNHVPSFSALTAAFERGILCRYL
jgi:hypothetical protein